MDFRLSEPCQQGRTRHPALWSALLLILLLACPPLEASGEGHTADPAIAAVVDSHAVSAPASSEDAPPIAGWAQTALDLVSAAQHPAPAEKAPPNEVPAPRERILRSADEERAAVMKDLFAKSPIVLVGTVTDISDAPFVLPGELPNERMKLVTVRVEREFRGSAAPEVTIMHLGTRPSMKVGQRAVFFVSQRPEGLFAEANYIIDDTGRMRRWGITVDQAEELVP